MRGEMRPRHESTLATTADPSAVAHPRNPAARIPAWLGTLVAILLLGAALGTTAARTWNHRVVPGDPQLPGRYGFADFRDGIYYPTLAFVDGDNPYDGTAYLRKYPARDRAPLYSPLMYLMHAPLALVSFDVAAAVYLVFCVALTIALGASMLHWSGVALTPARVAVVALLLVMSRPGIMHLALVNVTLVTVFLTYLAFLHAAHRPRLSAAAVAVATFKGTYGLPIALLLWARGDRRVVLIGIAMALVLTAPAAGRLAVGAGGVVPIVQSLRDTYDTRLTVPSKRPENSPYRIDAIAFAARMLGRSPTTAETLGIMAVILIAAGAALRRLRPSEDRAQRLHAIAIAALAILAAFYHQAYDALALALPLLVLVVRPDLEPWRSHPGWRWAALVLVAVPFLNYLATVSAAARYGDAVVLVASSLNGLAILLALALYVRLAWRMP